MRCRTVSLACACWLLLCRLQIAIGADPAVVPAAKQSSTTTTDGAAPSATNAASSTTAEGSPQPAPSGSEPSKACSGEPLVQGYDPITLGYTWQSNDEPYVDFTLSFKAPLFRDLFCNASTEIGHLYLTFTGRFAFYVATRSSGPVIGREYNPKLLWRFVDESPDAKGASATGYDNKVIPEYGRYIDFAYAHSSDGQNIDSLQEYQIQSNQSGSARDALDYISRGWDYLETAGKVTRQFVFTNHDALILFPDLKFFLRHGFLQGVPEEIHSWEQGSTLLPRHAFDGVSITAEYRPFVPPSDSRGYTASSTESLRFSIKYLTGYDPIARYNTVRGEFGYSIWGLPLSIWVQDGYMNSLARYYMKARSVGVEMRFIDF